MNQNEKTEIKLEQLKAILENHTSMLIVLQDNPDPDAARLADSVETALRLGEGVMLVAPADEGAEDESASFEQNLERLEQIVAQLEEGGRGLDESLRLFEEGVARLDDALGRLD